MGHKLFFSGHGCPHPFSLFLRPLICIVNLCAHSEDPAFIACVSTLWQAGYSLVLVTVFIYPYLLIVPTSLTQFQLRMCFKDSVVKQQIKAKPSIET